MLTKVHRNPAIRSVLRVSLSLLALLLFLAEIYRLQYLIGEDFPPDHVSAQLLWEGLSVYGPELAERGLSRCDFEQAKNFHPPLSAVLYLPSRALPCQRAYFVTETTYLLAAVSVLLLLGSSAFRRGSPMPLLFVCIFLVSRVVTYSAEIGQSSLAIIALLFAAYLFLSRGSGASAGVCVGLACCFKLFPAIYGLHLLYSRQWKALLATMVTVIAILGVFLLRGQAGDLIFYVTDVAKRNVIEWGAFPHGISLSSFVSPLFLDSAATRAPFPNEKVGLALHQAVLVGGLLVFTVHVRSLLRRNLPDLAFAATGLYMMLIAPISWLHFAPFLFFSSILILQRSRAEAGWNAAWMVPLGLSLLLILPSHADYIRFLTRHIDGGNPPGLMLFVFAAKPGAYAALIQLGTILFVSGSRARPGDRSVAT